MGKDQQVAGATLRELFKFLNHTYSFDLKSPKLVGIVAGVYHLDRDRVTKALEDLEERELIEVIRADGEIVEVAILDDDWKKVPEQLV